MEELSGAGPASEPGQAAQSQSRRARVKRLLRWYAVVSRALHRTVLSVLAHDCLNVAQSTAYSAIVALFPALIVAAAIRSGATRILSEDLNPGQQIAGIQIVNPFALP